MYLFHDDKQSQASPLKSGKVSSMVNNFQNVTAFQSNTWCIFMQLWGSSWKSHWWKGIWCETLKSSSAFFSFSDNILEVGDIFFHRGLTPGIKILSLLQIYRAFDEFVSLPWCFRRGLVHGHDWASPFKSSEPSLFTLPASSLEMARQEKGIISLFLLLL